MTFGMEDNRSEYNNNATFRRPETEWDDGKEEPKPSICCLQGCLAASAVGFSFFVALPTGIILVVLSANDDDTALLAVGCVLIVLPVLMLLAVILLCLNQKKLCCNRTGKKNSTRPRENGARGALATTRTSGESPA